MHSDVLLASVICCNIITCRMAISTWQWWDLWCRECKCSRVNTCYYTWMLKWQIFGLEIFFLLLEDKWNKRESEFSKMNMRNDNWARRWFDAWKTHWNMDISIRIEDILLKRFTTQMLVKIFMMMVKTNMECYLIMSLINIYLAFNHIYWATNKNIRGKFEIMIQFMIDFVIILDILWLKGL
jgi:hypothetical protein